MMLDTINLKINKVTVAQNQEADIYTKCVIRYCGNARIDVKTPAFNELGDIPD